ncbi:hypothetical protein BJV77DRAFT_451740 [Russula vinacea]|nr:hypothetical protein BJV77DRAFT_451740 [Russula vinacea]
MDKDKDDPASQQPQGHEFVVFSVGNITLRHYRPPHKVSHMRFYVRGSCETLGSLWVMPRGCTFEARLQCGGATWRNLERFVRYDVQPVGWVIFNPTASIIATLSPAFSAARGRGQVRGDAHVNFARSITREGANRTKWNSRGLVSLNFDSCACARNVYPKYN